MEISVFAFHNPKSYSNVLGKKWQDLNKEEKEHAYYLMGERVLVLNSLGVVTESLAQNLLVKERLS